MGSTKRSLGSTRNVSKVGREGRGEGEGRERGGRGEGEGRVARERRARDLRASEFILWGEGVVGG